MKSGEVVELQHKWGSKRVQFQTARRRIANSTCPACMGTKYVYTAPEALDMGCEQYGMCKDCGARWAITYKLEKIVGCHD